MKPISAPFCFCLLAFFSACKKDMADKEHFEFKYGLGASADYRYGSDAALHHSAEDSAGNLIVRFGNGDSLHFLWVTKCYPGKSDYLFGETYGIDSDIMIVHFRNNESTPRYWVTDQGIFKNGALSFSSWEAGRVSGSFDFDANTFNPDDLSSAVYNFKGSFDLPVK